MLVLFGCLHQTEKIWQKTKTYVSNKTSNLNAFTGKGVITGTNRNVLILLVSQKWHNSNRYHWRNLIQYIPMYPLR
ncbi:MAG TPA: hypothetical protein DER05_13770 [Lutibacter sp.]|nr:hypothetical protein [Lutibacter sp.]